MAGSEQVPQDAVHSRALGVDLDLPGPSLGLPPDSGRAGRRSSRFAYVSDRDAEERWAPAAPVRIVDRKGGDTQLMTVDSDQELGYRYWGRGFGHCLISPDGSEVLCCPETADVNLWQRFVIGQILPFVAPLQGLEVMHGSAVEIDGGAVACLCGSGGGKSSLAAQFMLRGAPLITDDVLSLEREGGSVMVHPGPRAIGIRHREADRLGPAALAELGPAVARNEKEVVVAPGRAARKAPLVALYFIRRQREAAELRWEPTRSPELLLGSTFNTVLKSPGRMERMLDVCLGISETAATTVVSVPPDLDADGLAEAILGHLESGP